MTELHPDMFHPALPKLMQLVSPALPIGGFAYSHGLEWAIEAGWVKTDKDAQAWVGGLLENAWCRVDVPALKRLYEAEQRQDEKAQTYWSAWLTASRETEELAAEDRHQGLALARLLENLGVNGAARWKKHPHAGLVPLWACAAVAWEIPLQLAALGQLWSITEQQIGAAIKLVPLGQSDGQRILLNLGAQLPQWAQTGLTLKDDEIGAQTQQLAIASALHETQYSRLFRS